LEPGPISIPGYVDKWDDYFLNIAKAVSIKSKDDKCPVGAVIVSEGNVVLSTGFNGLARGVHDDLLILTNVDEKLKVICHAENNAILNAARVGGRALDGTTIYVTKFPCLACCNAIIQAGIRHVYTHDDCYWRNDPFDDENGSRKRRILHEARIQVIAPYHPDYMPGKQIIVAKRPPVREMAVQPSAKKAVESAG